MEAEVTFSRRTLLKAFCAFPAFAVSIEPSFAQEQSYADQTEADEWMQAVMGPAAVSGALHVMRFADAFYATTEPIRWTSDNAKSGLTSVDVPRGFVTDFASVPRVFWSLFPRDGSYTYPAIVHDYLYWQQSTSREDADQIFDLMMKEFKVPRVTREAVYLAVRSGGSSAWNGNSRAKAGGERRIVSRLPTDPLVRWRDWKKSESAYN
jgi:hypothetical protein